MLFPSFIREPYFQITAKLLSMHKLNLESKPLYLENNNIDSLFFFSKLRCAKFGMKPCH